MRLAPRLLAAALVLGSLPAAAQSPRAAAASPARAATPLSESLLGQAKLDYDLARLLYDDGDVAGALLKFERAYRSSQDPRLLWNMATCEKDQRHYAQALRLLRRYRHEGEARLTPTQQDEAERVIQALGSLVSSVRVEVEQPAASVAVDGETLGTTPLSEPLIVDFGKHQIRISKPGFQDKILSEDLAGGADVKLEVSLRPEPREGHLLLTAPAGATIELDEHVVGQQRWEGNVTGGSHRLHVSAPGNHPRTIELSIAAGQSRSYDVSLEPDKSTLSTLLWIGGGVLVASGLGVGGYLLFHHTAEKPGPSSGTLSPGYVQLP